MSMRFRLIGLVAVVLLFSLAVGGLIACVNASRSVRTEMGSALQVARQTVDNAVRGLQSSADPRRDLDGLVASFAANRHLRVAVTGGAEAAALPVSDRAPFGEVPGWFVWLVGVAPLTDRLPVTIGGRPYGTFVIKTDPRNEILEVWNEVSESVAVLTLFCGLTIGLIYLSIGRALRPLDRLAAAFDAIARGDYQTRIDDRLTPELWRLRDNFNRMAARLAESASENRRLTEQLLTLQEAERSDIARDLHDEVSPFLFAINIDLATISRLVKERRTAELSDHVHSVADAVHHMQREVRSLLGRLRPIGLAEFGLADSIGSMVEFWRRRHPEIEYRVSVSPDCQRLGELADTTIYRVVQEALSNAVRHGRPTRIAVSIDRGLDPDTGRDATTVQIADDGEGMRESSSVGYGLLGMSERVRALGGRLTFGNRSADGFGVTAIVPCASTPAALATVAS
ncbi:MAG TPA: histidine kinase [Candidatus Sulfotelmatobacter sp.]|nr:histidine kinase [Candidatus Sulfotelmatobacter sp.]